MDDVTIVGAGPAGTAAALVLARGGAKVSLLDKARFPRSKACAEFISPGTSGALKELGLESTVRSLAEHPIRGFRIEHGHSSISGYYRDEERGFACPRARLDIELATSAVKAGASLCEEVRAVAIEGNHAGVRIDAIGPNGETVQFRSRFAIGADGINSLVSHRLGLRRPNSRLRRLGIVAHIEGIDGLSDLGEMHIGDGYFCGIAPFSHMTANVAMVVPAGESKVVAANPVDFLSSRLRAIDSISQRLDRARTISPILSIGPLAVSAASVWKGPIVLAGDAGGFYDPFTGQGIFRAIRGGQLAGEAVLNALASGNSQAAFARYASGRRSEFRGGWVVERVIQSIVARPRLLDRLMSNLNKRNELANTLVRVTGDTSPAGLVLNPAYIFQAFH